MISDWMNDDWEWLNERVNGVENNFNATLLINDISLRSQTLLYLFKGIAMRVRCGI